ncbi:MAG: PIN/TRAM domain-containing protein [Tissierellia bacterium]|nr:PIN/TRAM domain-containing protein [Tissierellia bacterium]
MLDKILRGIISLIGLILGIGLVVGLKALEIVSLSNKGWLSLAIYLGTSISLGIIFFILAPNIMKGGRRIVEFVERELQKFPAYDIVIGSAGLIIGLIIAYLLSQPFYNLEISYLGVAVSIILYSIFGYLGIKISTRKREDLLNTVMGLRKTSGKGKLSSNYKSCPKILDTSVIIDGRIADICRTDFVEGPLIIPGFVLEELQHIADSSDALKRNRGRRGLDILNKIQKELDIEVVIHDEDFEDIKEVDSKLLKLTQLLEGKIITNDYNLNKVAEVQNINVLNINELANAVKPVVLPGEEMEVQVIKDGKESGQGLAYLDDGTMIVVESGKRYIGKTIDVLVTSVLQTSAGRMIFAKPKTIVDRAI